MTTAITYKRQVGSHRQCGHAGCPDTQPTFRVILGHFRVQVYVCDRHTVWAIGLDSLSQEAGEALGWEHGYAAPGNPNFRTLDTTKVAALLPHIQRTDYARDESANIADMYPTPEGAWA